MVITQGKLCFRGNVIMKLTALHYNEFEALEVRGAGRKELRCERKVSGYSTFYLLVTFHVSWEIPRNLFTLNESI